MSWGDLDNLLKDLDEKGQDGSHNKQYCALINAVFDNPKGKELLDVWRNMIVEQTTYQPNQPSEMTFLIEGQHNFIRHVLVSMKLHRFEKQPGKKHE